MSSYKAIIVVCITLILLPLIVTFIIISITWRVSVKIGNDIMKWMYS